MESSLPTESPPEPIVQSGACYISFAFDAARSIDLEQADRRIFAATQRQTIHHKRRAPSYFVYQPPPLRVAQDPPALAIGRFSTPTNLDLILYDFGAIAVIYSLPIAGPFADLLEISDALYDNEPLLSDARQRAAQLLQTIGDAATQPDLADIVEDYVTFHISSLTTPFDAAQFCAAHGREIAQILRAERQRLSMEEVEDALSARSAFGASDLTIIDWNAALLIDREGEDVRAVLDFANVELLEMRHLDQRLDRALDRAYETLAQRTGKFPRMLGQYSGSLRSIGELQVDNALLFENVNNTLKLLGDQYLARVYRLTNRRFHLDEWDASILRKLQTIESIYEKVATQATNRRMEILEWVIIILIALSILIELVR